MNILHSHLLNNPNTSGEVITELTANSDTYVAYRAAAHPNLPYTTMKALALKGNDAMAHHLAKNPSIAEDIAYILLDRGQIETLVSNPYVSPFFLEQVYMFGLEDLYPALAENEGITAQLQTNLFLQNKWNKHLALNDNITENIINQLVSTNDIEVLQALTTNKRLTSVHIDTILKTQNEIINYFITSMYESPEVYELAIKNNIKLVKTLLKHSKTNYTTVDMLTKSKSDTVKTLAYEYGTILIKQETFIPSDWV